MRPTVSQYAEALELLSQEGMSTPHVIRNFLGFLKRRGELTKASSVVEQMEKNTLEQSGILRVVVTTAHEAGADMRALLLGQAEKIFSGKSVELQYEVNPALIGGARFRADETLYDATVSAELRALKKVIIHT